MRSTLFLSAFLLLPSVAQAHAGHPHVADNQLLHHGLEIGVIAGVVLACWGALRLLKRRNAQDPSTRI